MARKRTTVQRLAQEAGVDLDDALIVLWDAGLTQINGPGDSLPRREANRARRALGLATRRELSSIEYWAGILEIDATEVTPLLQSLGVSRPFNGTQLTKKAISRLNAEARERGKTPTTEDPGSTHETLEERWSPLSWVAVGHEREMEHLSVEHVMAIHLALVEDFAHDDDPISPPGVRSPDLLASAIQRPLTGLDRHLKYPTVEMAAASLLHSLVHDHPFHNGNKRTALVSMLVFLDENCVVMTCDEDQLFKLVLQLAQHALVRGPRNEIPDREVLFVAEWLRSNCRWIEQGDRAIPWRRLQRILVEYGCEFERPNGVGNRINITRTVRERGLFGRMRTKTLRTQSHYGDQGREVAQNSIHKIRHDLHLDDEHGVDSAAFYDRSPVSPSEFILRYRKTLKRLGRV